MATAFNLVDYRTVEPMRKPRLRIVAPQAARAPAPAMAPAAVPAAAMVAPVRAEAARPMPPAWMIAPPFRAEPSVSVHEPQAPYQAAPAPAPTAAPLSGPYRTVREVPRSGW